MKLLVREWMFQVQPYLPDAPNRPRVCRQIQRRTENRAYERPLAIRLGRADQALVDAALAYAHSLAGKQSPHRRHGMPEGFKQ